MSGCICEWKFILKIPDQKSLLSLIMIPVGLPRFHLVEPPSSPLSSHNNFDSSVFSGGSSFSHFLSVSFLSFIDTLANHRREECERPASPAGYEELTVSVGSVFFS